MAKSAEEDGFIDMNDPETFTREFIIVPDIDVTGAAYLDAIRRLIEATGSRTVTT